MTNRNMADAYSKFKDAELAIEAGRGLLFAALREDPALADVVQAGLRSVSMDALKATIAAQAAMDKLVDLDSLESGFAQVHRIVASADKAAEHAQDAYSELSRVEFPWP